MRWFRVSLAGLMVLIALSAVVFTSLREPTDFGSRAMYTLVVGLYGVALLGALLDRRERRPTWAGIFVFGAGYLVCSSGSPGLVTGIWIDDLYLTRLSYRPHRVGEMIWVVGGGFNGRQDSVYEGEVRALDSQADMASVRLLIDHVQYQRNYERSGMRGLDPDAYHQLCHADMSLVLAFVGALIARLFAARRQLGEEGP